jgi:hypothetical protein
MLCAGESGSIVGPRVLLGVRVRVSHVVGLGVPGRVRVSDVVGQAAVAPRAVVPPDLTRTVVAIYP